MHSMSLERGCSVDHNEPQFYEWQTPKDLLRLSQNHILKVGGEKLLSTGGELEKTVQQAVITSTFALCYARLFNQTKVRMTEPYTPFKDFELLTDDMNHEFEVTTAYNPKDRIREAWRGQRPEISRYAYSGKPVPAAWIASAVMKKTGKALRTKLIAQYSRHLVIYQNIPGGPPDLEKVRKLCSEAALFWASVWVISGVSGWGGIALLFNKYGCSWPTKGWLSYVNVQEGRGYGGFDLYLQ